MIIDYCNKPLGSGYNGMTLKVDKRFAQGLQMLGSFHLEQSHRPGFGNRRPRWRRRRTRAVLPQNLERGLANFDQTRRLVMSWVYDLPFGMNRQFLNHGGFLNRVVGGWQANGIVTFSDGTPFTVGCYCGDRSQTGDTRNTLRMNTTGNPLPDGFNRTDTRWFDTSVFATPALGTLGTSARNTLRSTPQRATDFSLFKNNQIGERVNVQLRAEFFNLFSSHYYQPVFPSANPQATNFGSLLPPGGDSGNLFNPRVIQFALRLAF